MITKNYPDNWYYLAFNYFGKIGPSGMQKIEKIFGHPRKAFNLCAAELITTGIKQKTIDEFIIWRKTFNFEKTINTLNSENINFVTWHEANYPFLLHETSNPPYLLYYKGNIKSSSIEKRLAVVGSRNSSAYAEKVIESILPPIISAGIEIVSGLAIGVDSLAHKLTLKYSGKTIAVLGSGLGKNFLYPSCNLKLAEAIIASGGLIISEFPPTTPPLSQNFPQRNRIISGLCQAVLIIEAAERSGSLITARYALEQNRDVLSIPGNIYSDHSAGTNNLIKEGAKSITNSDDILEIFNIQRNSMSKKNKKISPCYYPKNDQEKKLISAINTLNEKGEQVNTDELIKLTKLDTATINSTLSILEINGVVSSDGFTFTLN